ncbi:helix-turn-helix domain-containing protein [Lacticaseibacillus parakribbianus]|uniref:helix-turn-helix domain-containing protein n=1 Tax=Lacticaseibacillus parakribbianus TaxID=2970927 RepID=UPI0021CB0152|nr:helix-turn-helix transcriptional regulator [Lacticaseibacillus parakribbianus]
MSFEVNLKLIRESRELQGITQTHMAKVLGLPAVDKYSRREAGAYRFKATEIPVVASELGIPLEKIFISSLRKSKSKEVTQ